MGAAIVDQIGPGGELLQGVDSTLSSSDKNRLLVGALPGARVERYAGVWAVRAHDQIIVKKQVTHLGNPWPGFKKRIQIPKSWLIVERKARADGLIPRFVGIYHHKNVTIFVDFDPSTYTGRKANNSAAHVATNDLYQAQTKGIFTRVDRNGNRLTSVRADLFADYLTGSRRPSTPRLDVFRRFNLELVSAGQIDALDAVREMHAAAWPDRFQGEWPGFYIEYRLDTFLRKQALTGLVEFQKVKKHGQFDYDLIFKSAGLPEFYGDLKASNVMVRQSPGNDAEDLRRCIQQFGRFWYVIFEHETRHARNNENLATIAWNRWRRSVGHRGNKQYDDLSYAGKFKESVRFVGMKILEVNQANFNVVLGDFAQGAQPSGADRALKVMIKKRNIDNFLIYSDAVPDI